jgi:hypothetical protein
MPGIVQTLTTNSTKVGFDTWFYMFLCFDFSFPYKDQRSGMICWRSDYQRAAWLLSLGYPMPSKKPSQRGPEENTGCVTWPGLGSGFILLCVFVEGAVTLWVCHFICNMAILIAYPLRGAEGFTELTIP